MCILPFLTVSVTKITLHQHLQLPLSLVGIESGLFAALSASPAGLSCDELVEKTGMAIGLLSM